MLAIPLSSVVVGGVLLWFSLSSEDGLVVDDYYQHGLEINRVLNRDLMAQRYRLSATITFHTDTKNAHLMLKTDLQFDYPASVRLGISHATRPGLDRQVTLTRVSDKGYIGEWPDLVDGRWYLTLGDSEWRLNGVMLWPVQTTSLEFLPADSDS